MFIGGGSAGVGLITGRLEDWDPGSGSVVSWHGSAASREKARSAPVSPVPIGYMQAGHLRGFCEFAERGVDYSRVVMGSWDVPGRCDIRTMTYVINAHLRRHETYRSWFEYVDYKNIVRHTITDPRDIEFVPTRHGQLTPSEWHELLMSTPDPLQWDCFSFGIIQYDNHFAFYVIVDHLHCDPALITGLYAEIVAMYRALAAGGAPVPLPPTGSHDAFCVRERQYTANLTVDSPQVQKWIEFAERNGGTLPDFPLPLGDQSIACGGDLVVEKFLDPEQTEKFEIRCAEAGVRFSGGLFACAAIAHYELTGADTYYGLTPIDKRSTPEEYTTMGWFTGIVPITVPVDPTSFEETARATQASFDENAELAHVPFDHVLELAPWLRRYGPQYTMMNYMDAGLPPLSAVVASALRGANATAYIDGRTPAFLYSSFIRLFDEVSLMVSFPNNPVARESVLRYVEVLKSVFVRAAEGYDVVAHLRNVV
ncbi:condensation domain-containing protein [Mycobacterium sp. NPDC048908]|uniref:condensation domain-containing protein n=1 Tax=Mycobacterium sp. NPDC048908 TaxID=3364292 RepID=UPI00371A563F